MENTMRTFHNPEFGELGILLIGDNAYFPATECARLLGYSDPYDAIRWHTKGSVKRRVPTSGGVQEIKLIPEGDLYRLIIHSRLPSSERFEAWVFEEVLPCIRKTGLFATDDMVERLISDPDLGIRLLKAYKDERYRRRRLESESLKKDRIIRAMTPKASYYDLVLQNRSVIPISKIAKDYGMSGKAFNLLLHELGVQYRMGDTWLLYQHLAGLGYTQSRTHIVDAGRSSMRTCWTQKGRLFLYDLLKNQRGILPLIERSAST